MGAPHNTKRYGEQWNAVDLAVMQAEIETFRDLVVVSGGWAWHLMSPPHVELKHAHDHKDADLFVDPDVLWRMMERMAAQGYEKIWTRFDGVTDHFVRYTKVVEGERPVKVIFDLFMEKVASVETASGILVVEPETLLSFYGNKHSSVECFSVAIAKELIARGENPVGHARMGDFTPWVKG
ncbi:hypothetical protein CCAX7_003220 [Capsulimonas corticalis]|uniref:Uncharacterized protein n=1 Tax=Capsulimonas corticalis TaxID=2219043 RepID=A0A402CS65_9BACT|nr:hypothetical protein [Capsulimonas corticalis]BDI28271.1 hypothetical protein CCAX7_003220 [Capsulimonas corticalis]